MMESASQHTDNLISYAVFGLWLQQALSHCISLDELLDRAIECHFQAPDLLDLTTKIRSWANDFCGDYSMEISFPQAGNLGSIPYEISGPALESGIAIILHPPEKTHSVDNTVHHSLALLNFSSSIFSSHIMEWQLVSMTRVNNFHDHLHINDIIRHLTMLQQEFIETWHAQPQVMHDSYALVEKEIQAHNKEMAHLSLPQNTPQQVFQAIERLHYTQTIISAIKQASTVLSSDCEKVLIKLEKFYLPALTTVFNTALQKYSQPKH